MLSQEMWKLTTWFVSKIKFDIEVAW